MKRYFSYLTTGIIFTFWNPLALALVALAIGISAWQYAWINDSLLPYLATHLAFGPIAIVAWIIGTNMVGTFANDPEEYRGSNPLAGCVVIFIGVVILAFYFWAIMKYVSINIELPL